METNHINPKHPRNPQPHPSNDPETAAPTSLSPFKDFLLRCGVEKVYCLADLAYEDSFHLG